MNINKIYIKKEYYLKKLLCNCQMSTYILEKVKLFFISINIIDEFEMEYNLVSINNIF